MKIIINILRFIVGILFIFSGLIKANDPLGLSYKIQEFFEVWGLHQFYFLTLAFSVIMIAFEIVAGVAVILGWKMKWFSWLLLGLIVFFTFLTGYALFSGKIRECGCFGNCIPLQANQSFIKDLVLLVMILPIFYFRNKITPFLSSTANLVTIIMVTIFSFAIQWYVLLHLPLFDCLPYKEGKNILKQMEPPPGSIPDSTVISFVYNKEGKEVEFTADSFPEDFDDTRYTFVRRYDKLVRKGNAVPAIMDFSLQTLSRNDTTKALLSEEGQKLFVFLKDGYTKEHWIERMPVLEQSLQAKAVKLFLVTNLSLQQLDPASLNMKGITVLRADGTAIKTAARANPTFIHVDQATIGHKWSYADIDEAIKYFQSK